MARTHAQWRRADGERERVELAHGSDRRRAGVVQVVHCACRAVRQQLLYHVAAPLDERHRCGGTLHRAALVVVAAHRGDAVDRVEERVDIRAGGGHPGRSRRDRGSLGANRHQQRGQREQREQRKRAAHGHNLSTRLTEFFLCWRLSTISVIPRDLIGLKC